MNAQRLRSMFNRQNIVPFIIFFLLVIVVVCGLTTSTMRSSAQANVGNGRDNQRPPEFANRNIEDVKKDFNDDDLKVKGQEPRGKWGYGILTDMEQFNDASVPVAVGAMQSLSGGGKYLGVVKIKRLEIKNRSPKAVNSVQLRWKITSLDDPAKVLLEGTTPFVNFWAEANSSKVIEIPTIYPSLLFKPLAKDGNLSGQFNLTIGVQEAYFADGSFWRRQVPVVWLNILFYDQAIANRFPRLASMSPIFPPLRSDPGGSRVIIKPCEAKPRRTTSAFSLMPFQETTCQDDMAGWVNRETGQQSCGNPSPNSACYSNCNDGWCNVDVVPNSRCSGPSATPPPSPSPPPPSCTPEEPQPDPCCKPERSPFPGPPIESCFWNCRSQNCGTGTTLANGCVIVGGPAGCDDGYVFVASETYDGACCPAPPPTPTPVAGGGGCAGAECPEWDQFEGYEYDPCACISPVLVDTAGDGFRLTVAAGGVLFDFNGDGRKGLIAWTEAGSDDSWLALDRDGDGAVTSGRELFGDLTPQPAPPAGEARNGFRALAVFDLPGNGGNSDGAVDAQDAVFASLRLWRDDNHNGVSEQGELHALPALGVARLRLDYKESKRVDEHGNRFRYRAKVDDAKGVKAGRWAWDVFLISTQ